MQRYPRVQAFAGAMLLAVAGGGAALAQKPGGILRIHAFRQPGQHVDPRGIDARRRQPVMAVFNNLVMYDQHVAQNSLQSIVPELATEWRVERGRQGTDLPVAPGRQMARRQALHLCRRQMHLGPADGHGPGQAPHQPAQVLVRQRRAGDDNGDYEVTFHLKRPQPALLALLASGLVADLSLPRAGARDAAAPDRHRPVQIRRVQAERAHQDGPQPRLLEEGSAVSRRHRIHDHARDRRPRNLAFFAGRFDVDCPTA